MPRTRRWEQIVHGFSAGILSPAAQDQIDSQAWLAGAAKLENFLVERDGGISGRPAFLRSGVVVPRPRYGLLAGQPWSSDPGTGGTTTTSGSRHSEKLYDEPGGIAPMGLRTRSVAADITKNLVEVRLAGGAPRAITFHDVFLRSGSWFGVVGGRRRPSLRIIGHVRGERQGFGILRYAPSYSPSDADFDPFENGVFTPGRVPRDIVVRLDTSVAVADKDVDWIAIRFDLTGAATAQAPFELSLGGVSCFSDAPTPATDNVGNAIPAEQHSVELEDHVFTAPYRIMPWVIRDRAYVLLLGMDWVAMYEVGTDGSLVRRQGDLATTRAIWHFTERQLREMTWTSFGGNLLLCHHDFPHPLEVRLPRIIGDTSIPFSISPLRLTNVPELTTGTLARVAPTIQGETGDVLTIAPGDTRVPLAPALVQATRIANGLRVTWSSSGADTYRVYWDTRTAYNTAVAGGMTWRPGNRSTPDLGRTTLTYDITGLTALTEYAITVIGLIGTNESALGTPVFQTAGGSALRVPTFNTGVSPTLDAVIQVNFLTVANATGGYEIQVSTDSGATWRTVTTLMPTGASASYQFQGVAGTTYSFRMRALNAEGNYPHSPWSNAQSVQAANARPGRVTGLTAVSPVLGGDGQVRLSWTAVANATGYEVQRKLSARPDSFYTAVAVVRLTPTIVEDRTGVPLSDFRYTYRVRATRQNAQPSQAWTTVTVQVLDRAPAIVGNLQEAVAADGMSVTLTWDAVPRALQYNVRYQDTDVDADWVEVQSANRGTLAAPSYVYRPGGTVGANVNFDVQATRGTRVGEWRGVVANVPSGIPTIRGEGRWIRFAEEVVATTPAMLDVSHAFIFAAQQGLSTAPVQYDLQATTATDRTFTDASRIVLDTTLTAAEFNGTVAQGGVDIDGTTTVPTGWTTAAGWALVRTVRNAAGVRTAGTDYPNITNWRIRARGGNGVSAWRSRH